MATGGALALSIEIQGETGDLSYQWRRNGTIIPGATDAALAVPDFSLSKVGYYDVLVTDAVRTVTSEAVWVGLLGQTSPAMGTHAVVGRGFIPGDALTVSQSITYSGGLDQLNLQVLLPDGWRFVSSTAEAASFAPSMDDELLLEWRWSSVPVSPISFTYVVDVPSLAEGMVELVGLIEVMQGETVVQSLVDPDPLEIQRTYRTHSADVDGDFQLSLSELLRVIELYNTRSGTTRTGRYRLDDSTADGFVPDTESGEAVPLSRYHSADSDNDGALSLSELLRVIELYNTRSGTTRTGAYRTTDGTTDGFEPDV